MATPLKPSETIDLNHTAEATQKHLNVNDGSLKRELDVRDRAASSDLETRRRNKTAPLLGDSPLRGKFDRAAKLRQISRDFRSDTITVPTDEMLTAMAEASFGDDVYGEDEMTNEFQAEIAALSGKESALFVPSGTLSNQLGLRTHLLQPPYTVLCDTRSHIHRYEAGGLAFHSAASTELVTPSNGHHLRWEEDILPNLTLDDDIHFSPTRIISLENTLHGTIFPQEEIIKISTEARKLGLIMHLDGARIWNVAAETGLSIKELCDPFDSVSLCLSKGLGAPIGSILVGPSAFIKKARHFRKLFGAGVRQVGPLVAAARVAVQSTYPKLAATHDMAKYVARELEKLGVRLTAPVETNMVFMDTSSIGIPISELVSRAAALAEPIKLGGGRTVCHHQTDRAAVDDLLSLIKTMAEEKKIGKGRPSSDPNGVASASSAAGKQGLYGSAAPAAASTASIGAARSVFQMIATSSQNNGYHGLMKHSVSLVLPFPDRETAQTLANAISVDKELRPKDTRKEFLILPASPISEDGRHHADDAMYEQRVELGVKIFATTVRQLRLSVNAFLEDAALVCRTMAEFDPLQKQIDEARKLQLESELEQGSVGFAG
ncbi:hypothetical protein ACQY0O_003566 [Thecaphora frezii]